MLKEIYTNMPYPKKIFKGSEMPLLARLATAGEIVSIPKVLRKYRQHNQSAYNVEFKNTKSESFLKRKCILLKNLYTIRFSQLKVLFNSNYPVSQKLYILYFVYSDYILNFFSRIIRVPKKIGGRLHGPLSN